MKKRNLKNERGITLIALVITVVVLLILAGISINAVLGDNGLITKAKEAKEKTEQDAINTQIAMDTLYNELVSALDDNSTGGDGDTIDLSKLKIGDYVNYTYDTVSTGYSLLAQYSGFSEDQTIVQSATTLKWRVLNIDEENGTIDLVSANPSDNTVYFYGALGYNNGVYLLNDMCVALYSNSSLGVTARSINLADMENHLTTAGIAARNSYDADGEGTDYYAQYGTTKTYPVSYSSYPNLYATQKGAGINLAEGTTVEQPDLSGVDPYKESSNYYSTPTDQTYSQASDTGLTVTQTDYFIPINEENYGEAAAVLSNSNEYWVASRCVFASDPGEASYESRVFEIKDTFAFFGLRSSYTNMASKYLISSSPMYDSFNFSSDDCCLCPVVSLSSGLLDGTRDANGVWQIKQ